MGGHEARAYFLSNHEWHTCLRPFHESCMQIYNSAENNLYPISKFAYHSLFNGLVPRQFLSASPQCEKHEMCLWLRVSGCLRKETRTWVNGPILTKNFMHSHSNFHNFIDFYFLTALIFLYRKMPVISPVFTNVFPEITNHGPQNKRIISRSSRPSRALFYSQRASRITLSPLW